MIGVKPLQETPNTYKTTIVGNAVDSYFNGDDAGKIDFGNKIIDYPSTTVMLGKVLANTKVSTQQLLSQTAPKGGTLNINNVTIANEAKQLATDFSFYKKLPDNYESVISADFINNGFNNLVIGGKLSTALQLKPKGSVDFTGGTINADIIAPGANINFSGATTINNAKIITAGNFTNDKAGIAGALTQIAAIDGGSITAIEKNQIKTLTLGDNVVMDTSAGARISNSGEVIKGKAGNIQYGEASRGNNFTQKSDWL